MSLDATQLGVIAADLMEHVTTAYPEGATLDAVAIVVAVSIPAEDEDDPGTSEIAYRCSDKRRWIQGALFDRARAISLRRS